MPCLALWAPLASACQLGALAGEEGVEGRARDTRGPVCVAVSGWVLQAELCQSARSCGGLGPFGRLVGAWGAALGWC